MNFGNKNRMLRIAFYAFLFLAAVLSAYAMRYYHFSKEAARYPKFLPFTKESAMMYSYALEIASGKTLPLYDKLIVGSSDVQIREEMSLGLEYFLGYGYRLKNLFYKNTAAMKSGPYEDNPDFTSYARFQIRLWISMTAGIIFLWLIILRCPWPVAFVGALIYAVTPAAVSRATGQDLIKELFCIPFIASSFMFYFWFLCRPGKIKLILLMAAVFASLANWDMSQLCLLLWLFFEILRVICGGVVNKKRKFLWICIYISAVAAGLSVPYLKTHFFLMSPAMSVFFPSLLLIYFFGGNLPYVKRIFLAITAVFAFLMLWFLVIRDFGYSGNYGHFFSLILAKIHFLNVKPADPSLLNFDARILWTPALHSASFILTRYLFPATPYALAAFIIGGFIFKNARHRIIRGFSKSGFPIFMAAAFFLLYIFLVRFHVLCIIFLSVALALTFHDIVRKIKSRFPKILLYLAGILVLLAEADYSLKLASLGRSYEGEYAAETNEFIRWFRESDVSGRIFLTSFTISPMLKAYCGAGIVLQPKFELPGTRKRVEDYLNIIYHGTEKDLMRFCEKYKVDYYVFDRGYNGPMGLYSTRYCANAKLIERQSPVFRMSYKEEKSRLRRFYEIKLPENMKSIGGGVDVKYTIFKVISGEQSEKSENLAVAARIAYQRGLLDVAKGLAEKSVYMDPHCYKARIIYAELFGRAAEINLKKDAAYLKTLE